MTDDPRFALDRVRCLRTGSTVALERGDGREGVVRALAARSTLRESPFATDEEEMNTSLDVAQAYSQAGQDVEAISEFERTADLMAALGRNETETAVVLFTGWALELDQVGRPLEAEKIFHRVININRDNRTEDAVFPTVLCNYARVLRELDRLDEASDYAERAYNGAQRAGHELTVSQTLLERARVLSGEARTLPRIGDACGSGASAKEEPAPWPLRVRLCGDRASDDRFGKRRQYRGSSTRKSSGDDSRNRDSFRWRGLIPFPRLTGTPVSHRARNRKSGPGRDRCEPSNSVAISRAAWGIVLQIGLRIFVPGAGPTGKGETRRGSRHFLSAAEHLQKTLGSDHPLTRKARALGESSAARSAA